MNNISKLIDHTILKPEASIDDIRNLCIEAKEYGFYSVCVNSAYVNTAYNFLLHSDVKICYVVGFPLCAMMKEAKAYEAKFAVDSGADEIDMVINIGFLKSGKIDLFERDIKKVTISKEEAKKNLNKDLKIESEKLWRPAEPGD